MSPKYIWAGVNGQYFMTGNRSVIITLSNGNITACDFSSTTLSCSLFGAVSLNDDSTACADRCDGGGCNYNATVFVSFKGTDSQGIPMTSFNKDVALFKSLQLVGS